MRNKRLFEYIKVMKLIAGKRHKGRNGALCKIIASMEKETQLPWWKLPGPIEFKITEHTPIFNVLDEVPMEQPDERS